MNNSEVSSLWGLDVEGSGLTRKPCLFLHKLSLRPLCGIVLTGGPHGDVRLSKHVPPLIAAHTSHRQWFCQPVSLFWSFGFNLSSDLTCLFTIIDSVNLYYYFEALDLTCLFHLVTRLQPLGYYASACKKKHCGPFFLSSFFSSGFSCRLLIVMFWLAEVVGWLTAPLSMSAFTVIKVPCA